MKKVVLCMVVTALVCANGLAAIVDVYGTSGDMELRPDATTVRFEDYLGVNGASVGDRLVVGNRGPNADDFINPSLGAPPVGLLIAGADSSGNPVNVQYKDNSTSYYATDLMGIANTRPTPNAYGNQLVFTFVDPADPTQKATVSGVSFRWGDIEAGHDFQIRFYDVNGAEIAATDNAIPAEAGSLAASTRSYVALDGTQEVSLIHQVKMIYVDYTRNDYWTVGTYVDNAAKVDMSFTGFVPEPATMLLLGAGVFTLRKRK